jgi:hypothetical protein
MMLLFERIGCIILHFNSICNQIFLGTIHKYGFYDNEFFKTKFSSAVQAILPTEEEFAAEIIKERKTIEMVSSYPIFSFLFSVSVEERTPYKVVSEFVRVTFGFCTFKYESRHF